jgi:hypothetical protein
MNKKISSNSYDLTKLWKEVLLKIHYRATRELLNQKCRLVAFDGQVATVNILASAILNVVKRKQLDIETAFFEVLGTSIVLNFQALPLSETPTRAASINFNEISSACPKNEELLNTKSEQKKKQITQQRIHDLEIKELKGL